MFDVEIERSLGTGIGVAIVCETEDYGETVAPGEVVEAGGGGELEVEMGSRGRGVGGRSGGAGGE